MSSRPDPEPTRCRSLALCLRGAISRAARTLPFAHALRLRLRSRQQVYATAYESKAWRSDESGSGTGPELRATAELRADSHIGVDIVPAVIDDDQKRCGSNKIRLACLDLTTDPLPAADLILCRACLFHLSFADGRAVLNNFKKTGAKYLLTNYFTDVARNVDQFTGVPWRPLDLRLPPFGFPEPIECFHDHGDVVPTLVLGLWRFADLRL